MADDVIFPPDDEPHGPPGSHEKIDGVNYMVMIYAPVGGIANLPDGSRVKMLELMSIGWTVVLYTTRKARDN